MCGICGEIRFDGAAPEMPGVERMVAAMVPRGPDSGATFSHGAVAFGHRRLKIIDLSDNANQPLHDPDSGLTIVFNGCIYNYQALREELQQAGHRFRTTGDTEVILKAFAAWGWRCVERFHGMFAFAILDPASGRVTVARDRLGIKPFYYTEAPGRLFRFASTLPALLQAGGVNSDIDPLALHYYMTFHAVVPAPHTILQGVRKLPPATVCEIEPNGRRTLHTYWHLTMGPRDGDRDLTAPQWERLLEEALRRAVRRRLVADVPVGVLLSGGLDSSLIVGLLAEEGQTGLETFSIGFEDVAGKEGNEFRYSDVIARHYATRHHQIPIPTAEMLAHLPDAIGAMAEPMVSHDNVGFYLLSREVAKHLKVVQSGQGADEVFAGYHWYPPMLGSQDPVADYARNFFDRDHAEFRQAVDPRFHQQDYSRALVAEHFAAAGGGAPIDQALRLDTTVMLVDDPVKRVDSQTMAWGLEARVPFLDHELVELAARIPGELKVADGGKGILKSVARRIIPNEVIDRPKGYFPVPALTYIQGPVLTMVQEALSSPRAKQRRLFNPAYLDTLLADPAAHITPLHGSKLWQVALLELWLQRNAL